jgi:hypothetical protein
LTRVAIAAPGLEPNPMLVKQLLHAVGGDIRHIADALTRNAPLFDEELPDEATTEQISRVRALLKVLERAAARPRVTMDGRPVPARSLVEEIDNADRMLARHAAAGTGPAA